MSIVTIALSALLVAVVIRIAIDALFSYWTPEEDHEHDS